MIYAQRISAIYLILAKSHIAFQAVDSACALWFDKQCRVNKF